MKGGKGFCVAVLHEYVDNMEFEKMEFDDAIRHFLGGFRLPGEAQKIDRIMEKFAERYSKQNPSVFATADTAFILAFSIIMLNTDLHNPSIKEEVSKADKERSRCLRVSWTFRARLSSPLTPSDLFSRRSER